MAIDLNESKIEQNEFGLWLKWTLATVLGMLLGYIPLALVVNSIDLGIARILAPIISGILIGLAQWIALRSYVTNSQHWILNHAAGWVIGYALGLLVVQALARTRVGELLGYVSFGIIIAVFQWPVLRREIPHLTTWILANIIGWTLGAYLSQLSSGLIFQNQNPSLVVSVLVNVGITGLVAGAITAFGLIWIVRQPDRAFMPENIRGE